MTSIRDEEAIPAMPPDPRIPLVQRIRVAAMWTGISSIALRLGNLATGIVAARIISPHQFGVFAVAFTVYTIIISVSEIGVSTVIVRAKGSIDHIAPTIVTLALASSSVLTAIMYVFAPWLAESLGAPEAGPAIRLLSVIVLMGGLTAVPYAMLVREFRQDKRFVADLANLVIGTAVMVVLGSAGYGSLALAISRIAGMGASMMLLIIMIRPFYRPGFNRSEARAALRFSLPLAGASVVTFVLSNVDYIVVGRLRGALPLGYYNLAYNISGWPVSIFALMLNEVALPAFARVRDDLAGLKSRVSSAMTLVAALVLPISGLCFALAPPLVETLYGARWAPAAGALALLGLFGSFRVVIMLITSILVALGRSRSVLILQLAWILFLTPALIVGVSIHGIIGAALAQQIVVVAIPLPLGLWLLRRAGAIDIGDVIRRCALPAGASVIASVAARVGADLFSSSWVQLVVGFLIGCGVYMAILLRWLRRLMQSTVVEWRAAEVQVERQAATV
jgi:lipopolysaccharide exporter